MKHSGVRQTEQPAVHTVVTASAQTRSQHFKIIFCRCIIVQKLVFRELAQAFRCTSGGDWIATMVRRMSYRECCACFHFLFAICVSVNTFSRFSFIFGSFSDVVLTVRKKGLQIWCAEREGRHFGLTRQRMDSSDSAV